MKSLYYTKTIALTSQYDKEVHFTCAVRGFDYYRDIWQPSINEELKCGHEKSNAFDRWAIKVIQNKDSENIVGHPLLEISRVTKFLLDSGDVKITGIASHHW